MAGVALVLFVIGFLLILTGIGVTPGIVVIVLAAGLAGVGFLTGRPRPE